MRLLLFFLISALQIGYSQIAPPKSLKSAQNFIARSITVSAYARLYRASSTSGNFLKDPLNYDMKNSLKVRDLDSALTKVALASKQALQDVEPATYKEKLAYDCLLKYYRQSNEYIVLVRNLDSPPNSKNWQALEAEIQQTAEELNVLLPE